MKRVSIRFCAKKKSIYRCLVNLDYFMWLFLIIYLESVGIKIQLLEIKKILRVILLLKVSVHLLLRESENDVLLADKTGLIENQSIFKTSETHSKSIKKLATALYCRWYGYDLQTKSKPRDTWR